MIEDFRILTPCILDEKYETHSQNIYIHLSHIYIFFFLAFDINNWLNGKILIKAKYQTGNEIFVIILRRVSEDAFLSFASIEPYFVTEDHEKAEAMIDEYFPEGAEDAILELYLEDEMEEEEEYYEEEEDIDHDIEIRKEEEEVFATYEFMWIWYFFSSLYFLSGWFYI